MSLGINFKIKNKSCKSLVFTETTGLYSPSNTPGWETPNPLISNATAATLSIYNNSNTLLVTLDLFTTGLPDPNDTTTTHNWPNSSYQETAYNFYQGLIINTDLVPLSNDTIADGVYTYIYSVIVDDITYSKTKYFYNFCNVECCVDKLFAKVPDSDSCCNSTAANKALRAYSLLLALKRAAECYQKERFARLLRILQTICSGNPCNC
jgi:hypothetical protein